MKKQMKWMTWLALVLVAAMMPAVVQGAESSDETLARVRAAVGYERLREHADGVIAQGTAHYRGLDSKLTFLFTPDNRFRCEIAGPLGRAAGFNGTTGWEVDSTGMPRVLELEDLEVEQFNAWMHSGRWMAEDGPFAVTLDATKTDAQRVALALKLKGGLLEATAFVDRATWLPVKVTRRSPVGETVIELSDYREALGFRFPRRLTRTLGGVTTVFDVTSVAAARGAARAQFEPVTARPADTRWDTSAPARIEARVAPSGHILVQPLVNGKDVGWFLLDTGAGGMVIDRKAADQLAMPALGEMVAVGAAGTKKTRYRQGATFTLGPVTITDTRYMELDLGSTFSLPQAGICGRDLFARAVVELDITGGTVAVYDPAHYRLEGAKWQPLFFSGRTPIARGSFEGHEGLFRLDTGSDRTVDIHIEAVERYGLGARGGTKENRAVGVGGAVASRTARLAWFEFGGHRFQDLEVELAAKTGGFSDPYTVGNIGMGILRRFRIVFDFGNRRVAFVPRDAT